MFLYCVPGNNDKPEKTSNSTWNTQMINRFKIHKIPLFNDLRKFEEIENANA